MANDKKFSGYNQEVLYKARANNIPESALEKDLCGWLSYPVDKIRENEEYVPLPCLHGLSNGLRLYHIPENGKWCYGVNFSDSRPAYRGMGYLPNPLGQNFSTKTEAVNAGYKEFYSFAAVGADKKADSEQLLFDFE